MPRRLEARGLNDPRPATLLPGSRNSLKPTSRTTLTRAAQGSRQSRLTTNHSRPSSMLHSQGITGNLFGNSLKEAETTSSAPGSKSTSSRLYRWTRLRDHRRSLETAGTESSLSASLWPGMRFVMWSKVYHERCPISSSEYRQGGGWAISRKSRHVGTGAVKKFWWFCNDFARPVWLSVWSLDDMTYYG